MRRLRDKLLVAFLPLIVVLIGVPYLVQRNLVTKLTDELKTQLARSYDALEQFRKNANDRLIGEVRQIGESAGFKSILRDYARARRDLAEAVKKGDRSRQEAARAEEKDLISSIELDVGQTEVHQAGLDLLAFVDLDGRLVASVRSQGNDAVPATAADAKTFRADDPLIRTALENARSGRSGVLRSFLLWADGRIYMVAAAPLVVDGYVEGALVVGISRLDISDRDIIFEANGHVVGAPPFLDDAARKDFEQAAMAAWEPPDLLPPWDPKAGKYVPQVVPITIGGKLYLAAPCPLWEAARDRPLGWAFFIQPLDNLLKSAIEARLLVFEAGLAVLVLAVLGIALVASHITRPIENLSRHMREVGTGNLDQQAEVSGNDEVGLLSRDFNLMVDGLREKERLSAYVPEKVRDAIADVKGRTALGAKRVKGSILFSDLRGFTPLSERLDPAEVVTMLNEYLEHMQAVISQHGGYISDYIGDAIVAVFTEGRHGTGTMNSAYMAVRAAVEMQKSLAGLREHSLNPNLQSLRMGIGINTGFLVEGDMGPRARLKYAVLGDTVNTAARIQDRSKEGSHTCILVSGQTYESVREDFDAVFFGNELLKGKSEPVAIWEITGSREAVAALDGSQAAPG